MRQYAATTAKPAATAAAASIGGATSGNRLALMTATIATTRRNMTALATDTPAASRRGSPSCAAARRALVKVTAVDDTKPPAAPASSRPWLWPRYFTAA